MQEQLSTMAASQSSFEPFGWATPRSHTLLSLKMAPVPGDMLSLPGWFEHMQAKGLASSAVLEGSADSVESLTLAEGLTGE